MVYPAASVQPQRYAVSEECRSRGHRALPCFVYCFSSSTGCCYSTCCSFLCFIDIAWVIIWARLYMHLEKRLHIALLFFSWDLMCYNSATAQLLRPRGLLPTHPMRRPVIRMRPVHHLPSQMYAVVRQKTWRNSDELVTKLGLLLSVLCYRSSMVHSGLSENE